MVVREREMVGSLAEIFFLFCFFFFAISPRFLPFPLTAEPGPRLASTVTVNRKES